jgi:hypothetical protein
MPNKENHPYIRYYKTKGNVPRLKSNQVKSTNHKNKKGDKIPIQEETTTERKSIKTMLCLY